MYSDIIITNQRALTKAATRMVHRQQSFQYGNRRQFKIKISAATVWNIQRETEC